MMYRVRKDIIVSLNSMKRTYNLLLSLSRIVATKKFVRYKNFIRYSSKCLIVE